jgi:hypothetical protein
MVLQFPHFDPRVKPPLGTQLDRSDPINRGLDALWAMREGAGSLLHDASGRGRDVTLYGDAQFSMGRFGRCLQLDGVGDYGQQAATDYDYVGHDWSVSAWLCPAAFASGVSPYYIQVVVGRNVGDTTNGYWALRVSSSGKTQLMFRSGGANRSVDSPGGIALGQWVHVVGVVCGSTMTLYHDGVLVATTTGVPTTAYTLSSSLRIGRSGNAGSYTYYFDGKLDAVSLYRRALTVAEVAELSRDPFCALRRPEGRAWLGAMSSGGTNHALGGSVAAAASLSATLSIARPLSGSANAIAIPTGGIAVARSAAGSAAGQSSLSGSLGVARTLVGQIAAQPQVAASVVVARSLAGQIAGQSSMSGTLSTQGQVSLSGSISAASSAGGSLSATRSLDGHVTATAVAAASLSRTIALSGRVEAATSLLAAGSIVRSLAGGIDATASLTASTEIARSLSGSIAASASLSGSLLTPGGGSVTAIFLMLKKRR